MNTRSLLLTVPVTISMLTVAPLSAEAACWVWKPCANGYGAGGLTNPRPYCRHCRRMGRCRRAPRGATQKVLAPYPPDGTAATAPQARLRS